MKSKFLRLWLILAVVGISFGVRLAQAANEGDYSSEVLNIGVGARALGMGGAFVGAASDSTAAYWNPAGLALVDDVEVATIHATKSGIQSYDFVNCAVNTHKAGTYAISYIRLATGDIPYTTADSPDVKGYFDYADNVLLLSGGWHVMKNFAFGISAKLLRSGTSGAYGSSATGYGADLGFLYKPVRQLGIGLSIRDFTGGSYMKWTDSPSQPTYKINPSMKVGASYTTELGKRVVSQGTKIPVSTLSVNFDVDTLYLSKGLNTSHLGFEYWYRQFAALRGGFQTDGFNFNKDYFTPTFGVGVWVYLFEIDYAFAKYEISDTSYLSVITRF
jgi:hypothetical protein